MLSVTGLTCESTGMTDPEDAAFAYRDHPAFNWFEASDISMRGFPDTNHPGRVDVLPDPSGGFVRDDLDDLPAWLSARLARPDLERKVEKLRSSGRDELHLFLRVQHTGMPFELYEPTAFTSIVPTTAFDPPSGLTGLWLAPAWGNPILWWQSGDSWQRADCLDRQPV